MYLEPRRQKLPYKLRGVWLALVAAYLGVLTVSLRSDVTLSSLIAAPTPTPVVSITELIKTGDVAFTAGNLLKAEEAFSRAVQAAPYNDVALARYAQVLTYRRKSAEAVQLARRAVDADPRSVYNQAVLALALDWARQYDEAIVAGLRAIELDANFADAYAYLAEAYADKDRVDRATEMANKAVALNDDSWLTQRAQGYVYEKRGRYREAVEAYQRAIDRHPNFSLLYLDLGRNLGVIRGRSDEAFAALEKASELDSNNAEVHDTIGLTYYNRGKYKDAQERFKRAIAADPAYALGYAHLGWTHYILRQYEEAIPNFEGAIQRGATANEFKYELGLSYAFTDQCDKARVWLNKALEVEPDSEPALQGKVLCPDP
jgi:tetratricopeptide (TPR) repeat protein